MRPTIRICHLGKYYPPAIGGIETHVRTLALAQADLGAEVIVFCVNHQARATVEERDRSVTVTRFGRTASVAKLDLCPDLAPALARVEVDIVHLHVPNPAMILALLTAKPVAPVVVTYHSDLVRQKFLGTLFRPIEWLVYRRARRILATTPLYPAGSKILRSYVDRLQILPHGIDLSPYLEPSCEDRAESERIRTRFPGPLWLACGRLVYYKGLLNAIRALRLVTGTLVVVGEGPERPRLQEEARRLEVADRVHFLGDIANVVPYYLAALALWFPSNARSEAFGLVQIEAMASGCPVLNAAIPHSGVPWVSRHEETGLTVPVDDPAALAAAAQRILAELGLRQRLAEGARARAITEFDHRTMAQRSLDIYRCVLGGES
jgi:glycosyltransferase involved in cell wall biosynthesis